jgi:uncharacterized glyoxalase superfamily protein PhnB
MRVTSTAVSLTVDDVEASTAFLADHFGFTTRMAAPGFASLARDDSDLHVVFLRRGIEVLPEDVRDQRAAGVIVALVVHDVDAELARLTGEGVPITMSLRQEDWGERLFQVTDPNGVVIEIVSWMRD